MRILEIGVLACVFAVLIALLVFMLCYTRLRLAEIKAAHAPRVEVKGPEGVEVIKPVPESVDEGVENIMTYGVKAKTGDSL
ncbi:hypothetical protein [Oscillibacter sp.]|uniref:hypothetical protein n=1 Tax=Oscillibacter sp. TaxID=1945593 RepID=UPI003399F5F8